MTGAGFRSSGEGGESRAAIWLRRAVSVPAYLILALICLAGAPVWVLIAASTDAVTGQARRWPRTRAFGFFALYLTSEMAGIVLATLIEIATLGGRLGGTERYLRANATLQRWWSSALFEGSCRVFSLRVDVQGRELARGGPFVLFVRHASAADSILAAALVANPHRLLLRYVLKRELLWDPCLDIVGRRLPNAFIGRDKASGRGAVEAVRSLAVGLDGQTAALVFPEGTRFSEAKLATGVEALRQRHQGDLADIESRFRHVLPPRLGGALALMEAAPGVDVLLLEHTGFESATTFREFWNGGLVKGCLKVRIRRFPAATIPSQGRDRWLFERWREMDEWIEAAGVQPARPEAMADPASPNRIAFRPGTVSAAVKGL